MNNLALLILDERANVDEMIKVYEDFNNYLIGQYGANGITVLGNDSALEGNEADFEAKADIYFFPDWKTNELYRSVLKDALSGGDIYVMEKAKDSWTFKKAQKQDYCILDTNNVVNPRSLLE